MYQYNHDRDGIYVVVNGEEYKLQYGSQSIGTEQSKCAKCDFFSGSCKACESCIRIESQFPDSYWKLTCPRYVLCKVNPSMKAHAMNECNNQTHSCCVSYDDKNISKVTYTVGGESTIAVDGQSAFCLNDIEIYQ